MTPDQYCEDRAAKSGSSFYYSFRFLPAERRRAITALYAFCREIDDVVDEVEDPGVAAIKLQWWQTELERLFRGHPEHPVTRALLPALQRDHLPQAHFMALIEGMRMDLTPTLYPTQESLLHYCHHVAGVVGLLSAHIFGFTNPKTLDYARTLGLAFQLTNIIRDIGEDARRGRVYIPGDLMAQHGVTAESILALKDGRGLRACLKALSDLALKTYDDALAALPPEDRKAQRPGLMMAAIYKTLLLEIEAESFPVLHQRFALTPMRKLWLAWSTYVGWRT